MDLFENPEVCSEKENPKILNGLWVKNSAEREGFEPPVTLPPQRFSRPPLSTAQPSLCKNLTVNIPISIIFFNVPISMNPDFYFTRIIFREIEKSPAVSL